MNKKILILIILVIVSSVFLFSGCTKTVENRGNIVAEQPPVPQKTEKFTGSNYVVNREVWREIPGLKDKTVQEVSLHVPKFLIDSEDGKQVNQILDGIAADIVKNAEEIIEEMPNVDINLKLNAFFSVYQSDKILSVYMTYDNYLYMDFYAYIFNFRLSDGKLLEDEELAALYGFESSYMSMIENNITALYQQEMILAEAQGDEFFPFSPCYLEGLALDTLWDDSSAGDRKLYLDESGKLQFVFTKHTPDRLLPYPFTLPLGEEMPAEDNELNPAYIRMAHALSRDPYKDVSPAYIMLLGGMYDELSVIAVLSRLNSWSEAYNESRDVQILLRHDENSQDLRPYLMGEEAYLVVPKWEKGIINLVSLILTPEGEVEREKNMFNDYMMVRGNSLICINQSDIFQNSEVVIRYRDEKISFIPHVSLMDGSVVLPDAIIDAGVLLSPWKPVTEADRNRLEYSHNMFEKITHFIPSR